MRVVGVAVLALVALLSTVVAQTPVDRQKARVANKAGWDYMKAEAFDKAVSAFQQSIELDPTFEMPFYGLGRAHLSLKEYVSAISALSRCRDLYRAQGGRRFSNIQEAQRYRQDRILEIDEQIRLLQTARPTAQTQDLARQYELVRRNLQESIRRDTGLTIESTIPPWVSLSLGSAYFRSGKLADAETQYKEAINADSRSGEALNNLAVVYLETDRFADALNTLNAAKKTGFKVNPALEKVIRDKAK